MRANQQMARSDARRIIRQRIALSLVSCLAFVLVGCATGTRDFELGSGIVTPETSPSVAPTETPSQPRPSTTSPSQPDPTQSSPTQATPTEATPTPTAPSDRSPGPSTKPTPRVFPAGCADPGGGSPSGNARPLAPLRDDDAELDADGQYGNGKSVYVEDVQISKSDGFVVVCSRDSNRMLGSIKIARSNDDREVSIRLDEPITTTTRLLLVLLADNGDGKLDWATDRLVSGDDDDPTDLEVERLRYRYSG